MTSPCCRMASQSNIEACSAALGGVITASVTYPLDTTKVKLQASKGEHTFLTLLAEGLKNPATLYVGFGDPRPHPERSNVNVTRGLCNSTFRRQ